MIRTIQWILIYLKKKLEDKISTYLLQASQNTGVLEASLGNSVLKRGRYCNFEYLEIWCVAI